MPSGLTLKIDPRPVPNPKFPMQKKFPLVSGTSIDPGEPEKPFIDARVLKSPEGVILNIVPQELAPRYVVVPLKLPSLPRTSPNCGHAPSLAPLRLYRLVKVPSGSMR